MSIVAPLIGRSNCRRAIAFGIVIIGMLLFVGPRLPVEFSVWQGVEGNAIYGVILGFTKLIWSWLGWRAAADEQRRVEKRNVIEFGALIIVSVLTLVGYALYQQNRVPASRPVLMFIAPVHSFADQPFYSEMLELLTVAGRDSGFDVVPRLPLVDHNSAAQRNVLEDIARGRIHPAALIVAPAEVTDEAVRDLRRFADAAGHAVVFLDFEVASTTLASSKWPTVIRSDAQLGGRLAAEMLSDYFTARKVSAAIIAVFDRKQNSERVTAFREWLSQSAPLKVTFVPWPQEEFTFEVARRQVLKAASTLADVDAIFASNDAMALGARDAILSLRHAQPQRLKRWPVIIGYDGTTSVRRLIEGHDDIVIGDVSVNLDQQARAAVEAARRLASGHELSSVPVVIEPVSIRR